jgi:SAM-dependent methyltransferase
LLRHNELQSDIPIDLYVYECPECGFVQLAQMLDPSFYDDYLMTSSHSAQMKTFQQAQASEFVRRFGLSGKRVIEVGCGDGNYLDYLRQAGANVAGIEASSRFQELSRKRGFTVFSGYVSRESAIPEAPWDGFVTRQVLEHVPDPNGFLQGIRASLASSAAGLVEAPSLEQSLDNGRFYDFFADHVNYFSARTLRYALERNGFEVIDVSREMGGEYNVVLVRIAQGSELTGLQRIVDTLTEEIRDFIESYRRIGKRVAIWGAGGKGVTALAVANVRGVAYVIDSDPYKQGLFTPVSHFPVVAPNMLVKDPVEAVVITALAYRDEIITQLRKEIGFTGQIAIIGHHLEIVE